MRDEDWTEEGKAEYTALVGAMCELFAWLIFIGLTFAVFFKIVLSDILKHHHLFIWLGAYGFWALCLFFGLVKHIRK